MDFNLHFLFTIAILANCCNGHYLPDASKESGYIDQSYGSWGKEDAKGGSCHGERGSCNACGQRTRDKSQAFQQCEEPYEQCSATACFWEVLLFLFFGHFVVLFIQWSTIACFCFLRLGALTNLKIHSLPYSNVSFKKLFDTCLCRRI